MIYRGSMVDMKEERNQGERGKLLTEGVVWGAVLCGLRHKLGTSLKQRDEPLSSCIS